MSIDRTAPVPPEFDLELTTVDERQLMVGGELMTVRAEKHNHGNYVEPRVFLTSGCIRGLPNREITECSPAAARALALALLEMADSAEAAIR